MKNSDKLIQRLRQENVEQVPAWKFKFSSGLILSIFLAAVLLGGLAFSVILYSLRETGFWALEHLEHSGWEMVLSVLPFIWLFLILVFLVIAIYSIQFSKKGYKLALGRWVMYSVALSVVIGTIFYLGGGGQWLEKTFETRLSFYQSVQEKKAKMWMQPKEGFLAGTLIETTPDFLVLKDFEGKEWKLYYENAFIAPIVNLEVGEKVKLNGEMISDSEFQVTDIKPWQGKRGPRN
jgi:hypothetical protein